MSYSAKLSRFVSVSIAISVLAGAGCAGLKSPRHGTRLPASATQAPLSAEEQAILRFQETIEEALVWRAMAERYAPILTEAAKKSYLTHDQLLALHESGSKYLDMRKRILQQARDAEWIVDRKTIVQFAPGAGTSFKEVRKLQGKRKLLILDPSDAEGRKLLLELKLSLGAALVLYDNYLIGVYPYWENPKLRYLLDKDAPEKANQLKKVTESFLDKGSRRKVARAMAIVDQDIAWKTTNGQSSGEPEQYLELLIEQSPTYGYVQSGALKKVGPKREEAFLASVTEDLGFFGKAFSYATSMLFGNSMGLVEFRKGMLTKLSKAEQDGIAATLQPLDVLLEKTPFRLTDKFIPGHYGHVAIWVGSEEQLRELGVWDDKAVRPHHEAIRNGHRIVEALRPGVEINTLEHFLNIDDLAALRHKYLSETQRKEYLIRTFEQIGKEYDFNFDIETDKRIVCSELAYVVYHNVDWPTDKALGRYTISPDNVAIQATDGGPFEPVILYHDGKRIPDEHLEEVLPLLLQEKYKDVSELLGE